MPCHDTALCDLIQSNHEALNTTLNDNHVQTETVLSDVKTDLEHIWIFGQAVFVFAFIWIMYRAFMRWID